MVTGDKIYAAVVQVISSNIETKNNELINFIFGFFRGTERHFLLKKVTERHQVAAKMFHILSRVTKIFKYKIIL